MFSARHKTSMFLGAQPLFAKTSLIILLCALAACGSGGSQNDAGSLVAEPNEQQFIASASNTEQAAKPNNIWNLSAWDKTVWTSQPAAQPGNWNNDSWSETLWQ